MPVNITPFKKQYFLQKDTQGRQMPISELEMYGVTAPEFVGNVISQDIAPESYFSFLEMTGSTNAISAEQIRWAEETATDYPLSVVGAGVVTREGNTFTINNTLIPNDAYDIDANRPTKAQWLVVVGQTILVVDANKVEQHGIVTEVAEDGSTITAVRTDADADWTLGVADLDVIFTGQNLNPCECPECIGFKNYVPQYENTMQKDGVCYEYCEETEIANGGYQYEPYKDAEGNEFKVDKRIDEKLMQLSKSTEQMIVLGRRFSKAKADALGKPIGMKGLFEQIQDRALKVDGMIETLDDLRKIASVLKKRGIKQAVIHATDAQYNKLMEVIPTNNTFDWNPFQNNQEVFAYFGFKGVDFNGTKLVFMPWNGLETLSENLAKKYNFIITPMDKLRKVVNGESTEVGYVNLFYFGTKDNVYKMKRVDNGNGNCGKFKHDYINKLTLAVFHPEKFILGINP